MNALVGPMTPQAFPPNPIPGQIYNQWVWNGSAWVCRASTTAPVNLIKVFNSSGTYWPSPGLTTAVVEVIGGGGGGGYSRKSLDAALLLAGVQVTVGAGGPGQAGLIGLPGAQSSFGQFCIANGGGPGRTNTVSGNDSAGVYSQTWGAGGPGAGLGTGDFTVVGNAGETGQTILHYIQAGDFSILALVDGKGGAGPFGGAPLTAMGVSGGTQTGQSALPNTGAGGGGAVAFSVSGAGGANGPAMAGGVGGSGVVIVTEWCFGNTAAIQDCGCSGTVPVTVPCTGVTEVPPGWQYPIPAR